MLHLLPLLWEELWKRDARFHLPPGMPESMLAENMPPHYDRWTCHDHCLMRIDEAHFRLPLARDQASSSQSEGSPGAVIGRSEATRFN